MEIYKTEKNDDGTYSIYYKRHIKDLQEMDVEIWAETHRRRKDDIQTDIDSIQQAIVNNQRTLLRYQDELAACVALDG